jgi:hypothetical protein
VDSVLVESGHYPSIFVVMRDIHGMTGRGVATTTFSSVFSDPESGAVAKADLAGRRLSRPTWAHQTAPIGLRPLVQVASQNRRWLEAEVDR